MSTTNTSLSNRLGLAPTPEGLLAWHLRISEGFPANSVKTLAAVIGVNAKELAVAVGAPSGSKKNLTPEASNGLYRAAVMWEELLTQFQGKAADATSWLKSANPNLRGRVPLQLMATSIGYDYLRAAIARERES